MSGSLDQTMHSAIGLLRAGRLAKARAQFLSILAVEPGHAEAMHMAGIVAHQLGESEQAIDHLRRAVATRPDEPRYHNNLGLILLDLGRNDEAIAALRSAAQLAPSMADLQNNLGNALAKAARYEEAAAAFERAIAIQPSWAEAHHNLGNVLGKLGRVEQTLAAFRRAIALKPSLFESHHNLGVALFQLTRLDEAADAFQAALRIRPDLAETHVFLGNVRKDQGDIAAAVDCFRAAAGLKPDLEVAQTNLLWALHFHPAFDARAIAAEHAAWGQRQIARYTQPPPAFANDRSPDRRLRIGYVSPDFREHVIARNLLPLFEAHDRGQVEIFCYSNVEREDDITRRFRQLADRWRNIHGMPDSEAAARIRSDQIDILVDTALHLENNRLAIFIPRAAPVQVTFAGYPGSTGLPTMDYRLTDPYLDPPGSDDSVYSEVPIRLPETFWCYDPASEEPISPLPARAGGSITFGCLNHFSKTNERVFRTWGQVLRAVPDATLLLLASPGSHRQRAIEEMGVDPQRVRFADRCPREQFLRLFHRIDIVLDTFPYNGHSTSLDAMWMGVPVVTLCGQTLVSRAGFSQASNLGLIDLVAHTPESFVAIATELARDIPRLQSLRAGLRQRMIDSPLMNGPRFARHIEAAYRSMWQRWVHA